MSRRIPFLRCAGSLCALAGALGAGSVVAASPSPEPAAFAALHWRSIGPYRGGRALAVAGVAGDPLTFYFGAAGGGVWKTGNAGRTWRPVMDTQPVASIGALAVAPGHPNIVYAGSGEADMRSDIAGGNGMYRSNDAGATWTHVGLDDSHQLARILVDPHDPKTVLTAALGHAYGPNDTRGVFRSTDAGATWTRTLFHGADTGAVDLAADPAMHVVYASLWQTRRPPWSAYPPSNGPGSGLYKSADGGSTWSPLAGHGFPAEAVGKIGLAVAPSEPRRVYAIVDAKAGGLYRSDDAGANWKLASGDRRLWERGWYFCHVAVDPKNPDVVYVSDTALYRSSDGGAHFSAVKGSPDGDDFHSMWIDPRDPARMILASDQGASVSLDGAASWSSWFNQPTGQFYHIATDDAFPYRLYGAQQDSGAAMIVSRSDRRGIGARDWRPVGPGGESGTIAPDPRNENVVFGSELGGAVTREDLRADQSQNISPTAGRLGQWRHEWTLPLAFGPEGTLYYANQTIFRTRDDGNHWDAVSGDLARPRAGTPATLDAATAADADSAEPRGVIYALAPSTLSADVVWAGTDDGLVYLGRPSRHAWRNVTPPGITPWSHVAGIEASRFDARGAFVAVDRHRLDDERPYIYVTHDSGRTWRAATAGIPDGSFVNAVREDPVRPGLLYAATETGVFVSFDDGAAWRSLALDMPVVSVRDIVVHGTDLAIATHGRAFWILDDIEPLREASFARAGEPHLFAPRSAVRTRGDNDEAEASPPETPLGENPPNGAFIDYVLPADFSGPVRLEILSPRGAVVRAWSSADTAKVPNASDVPYPPYWIAPATRLPAQPGAHRFVWDFHLRRPDGPWAAPGAYGVRLTVAGRGSLQPLRLLRDPRVRASDADLVTQAELALQIDTQRTHVQAVMAGRRAAGAGVAGLAPLQRHAGLLAALEDAVESADAAPTAAQQAAWNALQAATKRMLFASGRTEPR